MIVAANSNRPLSGKLAFNIMHFGRVLRETGIPVGPGSVLDALDAVQAGPLSRREDFYLSLHAIFVKRREHKELFDQAFHVFWKKPKMLEQLMQLMYTQIARKPPEKRKDPGFRRLAEAMFEPRDVQSRAEQKKDGLWFGGTRIGSTLHQFNYKWARRVLGQGAHVLLMTDGLDREDVEQLKAEMKRLRLAARRIVWLNPLLRYGGFEARAAGIRAMMPFVDEFRPVHSLNSLADLAEALAKPATNSHDPKKWISA